MSALPAQSQFTNVKVIIQLPETVVTGQISSGNVWGDITGWTTETCPTVPCPDTSDMEHVGADCLSNKTSPEGAEANGAVVFAVSIFLLLLYLLGLLLVHWFVFIWGGDRLTLSIHACHLQP